jgi:hypothetical protein
MLYFGYDGRGYQSCRAVSRDLVNWRPDGLVHAHTMTAFSYDLKQWISHPEPILKAGGHGLDSVHAHNISLVYNELNDTLYMFYCAVGKKGRGIALLTNKPLRLN